MRIKKQKNWKDRLLIVIALGLIAVGVYLLIVTFSPLLTSQLINPNNNSTTQLLTDTPEEKIT